MNKFLIPEADLTYHKTGLTTYEKKTLCNADSRPCIPNNRPCIARACLILINSNRLKTSCSKKLHTENIRKHLVRFPRNQNPSLLVSFSRSLMSQRWLGTPRSTAARVSSGAGSGWRPSFRGTCSRGGCKASNGLGVVWGVESGGFDGVFGVVV